MDMNAEIKAMLVSIGSADIDEALLRDTVKTTIPSAGPGAGLESFFIKSGGPQGEAVHQQELPAQGC
jgi:hypothetical protein